ncbi:hypothetical protein GQX74_004242 [Glossina fuscipes]|nr:hypothetical protein GQX74_004242 [Glossina fuscipes]
MTVSHIIGRLQPWWCRNNRNNGGTNGRASLSAKHSADSIRRPTSNSGVWTWLGGSRRSSEGPDQIGPPSSSPAENHYTHMDDAYSPVGVSEALYAELDRESVRSANPSYQNTGYSQCGDKYNYQPNEQDIPMVVSSAPSSAYYSDLSLTSRLPHNFPPSHRLRYTQQCSSFPSARAPTACINLLPASTIIRIFVH